MLMPKRVKRRRVFRGRMKGKAQRGNFLAYGDFGIVATEPSWVTARQIEAARIALTRYTCLLYTSHLAMLLMICVLKQALSMESISQILLALCEEGVQAGYGRFCAITRKIEESARGGHIELFDRCV